MARGSRPFLTARWESLVMLNFECPEEVLAPRVPPGVELDDWQGRHLVSLVGFRFLQTRVRGFAIPGHQDFDEVNLRFYVRRKNSDGSVRRGVVFVRELVPAFAIALVAQKVYGEPYFAVPMSSSVEKQGSGGIEARYKWQWDGATYELWAASDEPPTDLVAGSEAEFITEHYWGYNDRGPKGTWEYEVTHPRWKVWEAKKSAFYGSPGLYGREFASVLEAEPVSALIAEGSAIEVFPGKRL